MIPDTNRPTKGHRLTLPPAVVAALVLLGLFGLVSLATRAVDLGQQAGTRIQLERVRSELVRSKQENRALRHTLRRVGERVSALELLAEEVQVLSRIYGRRGRKLVPAQVFFSRLTVPEAAIPIPANPQAFRRLFGKIDQQIEDLAQFYREGYFRLTYTPNTWPAEGYVAERFGFIQDRFGPGRSSFHRGIDISTDAGSPVVASADGTVLSARRRSNYGKTVILRHRFGISTVYAHLSAYDVKPGDQVRRGQVIGLVGNTGRSTGPHLHYEVRVGDMPVNPMRYISNQARIQLPTLAGMSIRR